MRVVQIDGVVGLADMDDECAVLVGRDTHRTAARIGDGVNQSLDVAHTDGHIAAQCLAVDGALLRHKGRQLCSQRIA